jgi:hypothetical protein
MTKDRDFKRLVRHRARQTGESYQRLRQAMRGGDRLPPRWSEEEVRDGALVAGLAIRMADGKPTVPGPPWTPRMSELARSAAEARDRGDEAAANELRLQFDASAAEADATRTVRTARDYLEARIAGRIGVADAAAATCLRLVEMNPRDDVASEALALLAAIRHELAPD